MKLWNTIDIADHELGLLYERDNFIRVLEPGRYHFAFWAQNSWVDKVDVTEVEFDHPLGTFFFKRYADQLEKYLKTVELTDYQVGLVYIDGHLKNVLAPGSFKAYWLGSNDINIEVIDLSNKYEIDQKLLALLAQSSVTGAAQAVSYTEVADEHVGLLYVNGKFERLLKSGNYGFWKYNRAVKLKSLDLRLQSMEVSGQEILTKDRVSLRINLSAVYKITDAEKVALTINDYTNFVYRELQLSLREIVGTQSLDTLLEDKDTLNKVIYESVRGALSEYGIALMRVGVKDIILPGDMKTILNRVVEAEKEAEANLIRRREETQAMRSLHNTAKVMENNPIILRLKELESLEKISTRIDKISVYGGLDSVMNDLIKLPAAVGKAKDASAS